MADEIERLVLSPFREIVEKANTAIENADDADEEVSGPMRKAAQSLAKEGERALKKIEPLCKKNYDEYGANFVDAMKEHGERANLPSVKAKTEMDKYRGDWAISVRTRRLVMGFR